MEPEITFIVTYECPRCHAVLEARSGPWSGWLRCPQCGRASLPPEHMRTTPPSRPTQPDEEVLVIGPEHAGGRRISALRSSLGEHPGSSRRIALGGGFLLSLIMLVLSLLDRNNLNALVFALAVLLCLGFLMLPARRVP